MEVAQLPRLTETWILRGSLGGHGLFYHLANFPLFSLPSLYYSSLHHEG